MFIAGSRFWFGVAAFSVLAAALYFVGGGAEKYGTLVLLSAAVASAIPGFAAVALRDADVAVVTGADGSVRQHRPAASRFAAAWPALAAVGAGVTLVGLAAGGALFYVGLGILGVTLVEWMVQAWAERSTGDPVVNQRLRNRIMYPIEIPATAAIGIAVFLLAFSRVLLALPKTGATLFAIVVATAILGAGVLIATKPRISSSVLSAIVVLAVLGLLGGGIAGAVAGERKVEPHGGEETGDHPAEAPPEGGG